MDTDLKCNRLNCRKSLTDKAVVTTCSHIFCVECANELFNAARLCPACDTSLTEPDDVVVCSLHPSNDYKTSVLSGLAPSTILEICTRLVVSSLDHLHTRPHKARAISFWQYQIYQENAFQQAVVRNVNDKNAQLQKQLENVVREANSEIALLNNKAAELERDLELERRKIRELQDTSRERDKEYTKLKQLHDKLKRKALLAPNPVGTETPLGLGTHVSNNQVKHRTFGMNIENNLGTVVGGMEANGIQRTPIGSRTSVGPFVSQAQNTTWVQHQHLPAHSHTRNNSHRQLFAGHPERSYRSGNTTDRSDNSANEVENMLVGHQSTRVPVSNTGWTTAPSMNQQVRLPQTTRRTTSSKFRPAGGVGR